MYTKQLEQIERLVEQAKFNEALNEIKNIEQSEPLTKNEHLTLKYLKSTLYLKKGQAKKGKQVADQLLEESREVGNQLRELDALINIIWALQYLGRLDDGLQLAKRSEKLLRILTQDIQPGLKRREAAFLYRKGSLLLYKGELDQALNSLELSLTMREEIDDRKGVAESLSEISVFYSPYMGKNELDHMFEYSQNSLTISEAIGDHQGIAKSHRFIGMYHEMKGRLDQAQKYYQKSLAISEAIGDHFGLAESFLSLGSSSLGKGELDQVLEYVQKALSICETIENQDGIAFSHILSGIVYDFKGDPDQGLKHHQKSLGLHEAIGNQRHIAIDLNNIGCVYGAKGDFKSATDYFERTLNICRKTNNYWLAADSLYQLIRFFVADLSPETVASYLDELQTINERYKAFPLINQRYSLAKAIVLKSQGRLADKLTAQTIFQQVAEEEVVWLELTVEALINLSELLLFELETTGNETALNELKELSQRLLTIAKSQYSYSYVTEAYLIQSKLKLLELNLDEARQLLTQAHVLTHEKGLHRLERIISIEQDSIVKQLSTWEKIIMQRPSMGELIKLTQSKDLITRMLHKRLYQNEEELIAYAKNARHVVKTWAK